MAKSYLIDTSAIIKYLNGSFSETGLKFIDGIIDSESSLSFITEIELQVWDPPNKSDLGVYQLFVYQADIIGIDDSIIAETIRIRKAYKLKLPDALIAATASVNRLTLIADNDKDFGKVTALKYLNPNSITI
ncbi:type II toxin-antitoxin system VapC family toxin [Mucilaginibacter psychrotolerans]|uniref:PIN domain-containing protein n=1 Tax=Mucilaginibacter psychrotolerans TaxID=1524096 RepID=A0A4Y8SLG5_9SPHI|nr:type II toxin-antitoxin system VapC family toxin [Mucilaginibacter psychrotolerans]TFF39226.1 PIN domain-containing protein [Mucilaginibacter psychrotolerans]